MSSTSLYCLSRDLKKKICNLISTVWTIPIRVSRARPVIRSGSSIKGKKMFFFQNFFLRLCSEVTFLYFSLQIRLGWLL